MSWDFLNIKGEKFDRDGRPEGVSFLLLFVFFSFSSSLD